MLLKTVFAIGILLLILQVVLVHKLPIMIHGVIWLHYVFPATVIVFGWILIKLFLDNEKK